MEQVVKVLVIRFSSIGDIILTTPVLRLLHQLEGKIEVHFLCKDQYKGLLEANPYVHKIHSIKVATAELDKEFKEIGFDYIIDLHNNIRSRMVKRTLKPLSFTVDKQNWNKWLMVNFGKKKGEVTHIVERYIDCLKAFGITNDLKGLDYYIPDGSEYDVKNLPQNFQTGFVCLAVGATHEGKRLTIGQIDDLINNIDLPLVLIGGKNDLTLVSNKSLNENTLNLIGKLSIHESASIVKQSRVVISGDTGMMHIAAAFKKKIISIWGCTSPELGMSPYLPDASSVVVSPVGREKRPCSKLGDKCKYKKDQLCIETIDVKQVVDLSQKLFVK